MGDLQVYGLTCEYPDKAGDAFKKQRVWHWQTWIWWA